jgi:hypothetical protein
MKKNIIKIMYGITIIGLIMTLTSANSNAGDLQDQVVIEAVSTTPGGSFTVNIDFVVCESHEKDGVTYKGIGSFCIPLLYNNEVFTADSMVFMNTITAWDEKFVNSVIDTGFISIAGIFDMGGKDNPQLFTGNDKAETVAKIFFHTSENAKAGEYSIDLTMDPRQRDPYFGSADGVKSWLPLYTPGKIVIE